MTERQTAVRPRLRVVRSQCGVALAVVLAVAAVGTACADSIWDRREGPSAFLYTDNLATNVGDSLTVLISEQSSFTKSGTREMEKTTSASGSMRIKTPISDLSIASGDLAQDSSHRFGGANKHDSSRQFADSITVTVIDKLPNGNLVVAGRSERYIEDEEVITVLTGIVKPEDISGANTIASSRVAHLNVYYEMDGPADKFMVQGLLNKIFTWLWPF